LVNTKRKPYHLVGLFYFKETTMAEQEEQEVEYNEELIALAEKLVAGNLTIIRDNTDGYGFCGNCLKIFKLDTDGGSSDCSLCGSQNTIV
jgi:predicted ferric reductase